MRGTVGHDKLFAHTARFERLSSFKRTARFERLSSFKIKEQVEGRNIETVPESLKSRKYLRPGGGGGDGMLLLGDLVATGD